MEKVINELRRVNFVDYAFLYIENNLIVQQFYGACKNNESLNEFYNLEEVSQVGVQLTAQISHSFYTFLKYNLNDFLESQKSFLRVVLERESNQIKSYDLVFINITTNKKYYLEIKLSQNDNSWQGSTSSTSKVDNFLLINFKIDRDKKLSLTNNNGLFRGVFAGIFNLGSHKWNGDAKSNNHRTSFDFRMADWSIDNLTENCIIKGEVIPKKVKYHLKLKPVNYEIIK
jgi:hypothetical protein